MFSLFKKKQSYTKAQINISGSYSNIRIRLKNFPILVGNEGKTKKEFYPDFNVFFIDALWKEIGKYSEFQKKIALNPMQKMQSLTSSKAGGSTSMKTIC